MSSYLLFLEVLVYVETNGLHFVTKRSQSAESGLSAMWNIVEAKLKH